MNAHLDAGAVAALASPPLAAGVLGAELAAARAHAASCARCAADLDEATQAARYFDAVVLPRTLEAVQQRLSRRTPWARWTRWTLPLAAVAVAAAILLVVVPRGDGDNDVSAPGVEAIMKGSATLRIVGNRGEHQFVVEDGTPMKPGDRIQFVAQQGGLPYLLIAAVDGAGQVSIYLPVQGGQSVLLQAPRVNLPGSITLDAAPGPERIFALFSRQPLSAEAIRAQLAPLARAGAEAIRAAREVPLVLVDAQRSILFEKELP